MNPEKLQAIFEQDAPVLTPNASLAQQLRRLRLQHYQSSSLPSGAIDVLQNSLLKDLKTELPLATDTQLRFLWEQVIVEQRDKNEELRQLNPSFLSHQALSAWRSVKRWGISREELSKAETGQLLSFSYWIVQFEKKLADQGLSTLELEIIKLLRNEITGKQPIIYLYAFIEPLAPLWQSWLEQQFEQVISLDYLGRSLNSGSGLSESTEAKLCAMESRDKELEAALYWAKSHIDQSPDARIAIIDVNLKDNLKGTQRRASKILDGNANVRFSRDQPLSMDGPIQTALALLSLNNHQIDLATARQIIHSPLWGAEHTDAEIYETKAKWDRAVCDLQQAETHSSDLVALLKEQINSDTSDENNQAQLISEKLTQAFSDRRRQKTNSPLQWCDLFQQQLSLLGCFEQTPLYSWQSWLDALGDFAALGTICPDMSISDALRQLKNSCSQSRAKASSSAPGIAFLDTIETAADYSHIWIIGMDNQSWPGTPNVNSLLPVSLQVSYQLPHSHPLMETQLAHRLIERLMQACDKLIFSYSRLNDDIEQSPYSLVSGLPTYSYSPQEFSNNNETERLAFEWVDCSTAPELADNKKDIKGGAGLLRTMAASPFDAFVLWRLGNRQDFELSEPYIGLSAADRGNLVHNLLERIWLKLSNSEGLAKQDRSAIGELCRSESVKELQRFQRKHGWLKQSFADLEAQRLADLVSQWLEFERERPEFDVILSEEQLEANIAGLKFSMRLDRLDRLPNGELILIDYKTGHSLSRNSWLDVPPSEPQLPLYALTLNDAPTAFCFAKVRADKMEFIGIGVQEYLKGIQPQEDWDDLMEYWKDSLESLAAQFIEGDTRAIETGAGFGRSDAFAPLHRFAEADQLEQFKSLWTANSQSSDRDAL